MYLNDDYQTIIVNKEKKLYWFKSKIIKPINLLNIEFLSKYKLAYGN